MTFMHSKLIVCSNLKQMASWTAQGAGMLEKVTSSNSHAPNLCYLLQVVASKEAQAVVSRDACLPPLLDAMVHSQEHPQSRPYASSAASFLMHLSSQNPLKSPKLESSSPSHPLFLHTSMQQPPASVQQSLLSTLQAYNRLQQSPANVQLSQGDSLRCATSSQPSPASVQQSLVRSWKSLRPESRATLDGGPTSTVQISRAEASINPVPGPVSEQQSHGVADVDTASVTTSCDVGQQMGAGQGRAKGIEASSQRAPAITTFSEQAMASGIAQQSSSSQLANSAPVDTLAGADTHLEHASKAIFACNALPICCKFHNSEEDSACIMTQSDHDRGVPDGADHAPDCCTIVDGHLHSSSLPALDVIGTAADIHSSTDRCKSAVAASIAVSTDFSLLKSSLPSMGLCERRSSYFAASEMGALSALNSSDLAYLAESDSSQLPAAASEQSATTSALNLCPSPAACISGLSSASAENPSQVLTDRPAVTDKSSVVQSRVQSASDSVRHPTGLQGSSFRAHAHLLQLVGDEDIVLSGSHSEGQLQLELSTNNAALTAESAADSSADACVEGSAIKAQAPSAGACIDFDNAHLQLADRQASCETLYDDDDDDWET